MDAARFALPSLHMQGHALPHDSGKISLTFMSGPSLMASYMIGALTPREARAIAAALVAAADMAEAAKVAKVAGNG